MKHPILSILLFIFLAALASAQTIFVAGDSTAAPYDARRAPMTGWAQVLGEFTVDGVTVEDRAVGGRSTKSFREEGRWDRLLNDLKPGDFVVIQFGHNDQKEYSPAVYAPAHTDFKANLTRFVQEVREKGGKPVLATSVTRRIFDAEGKLTFSLKEYPECLREVARETQTPLVDLYVLTRAWVEEAGPEKSAGFYTNLEPGESPNYPNGNRDNSHFQRKGALAVAEMFIRDAQRQGLEIGKLFKPLGQTPVFKPRPASEFVPRDGIGNVLTKLNAGEDVNVAYFGGSITETHDGWRPQTTAMLQKVWPNAKIHEIHAAIGATGSEIGVYRMDRDVLKYKPDLLFVEFAVNDGGCTPENIWKQFEGIVRKTWRANPQTDIVFCYTIVSGMVDGCRKGEYPPTANAMEQIADSYGIPSINFGPRVVKMLDEGKLIFKADSAPEGVVLFSRDGTHPIASGSALYTADVERVFRAMKDSQPVDHSAKLEKTFIAGNLEDAKLFPIKREMLSGEWRVLDPSERYGYYTRWLDQVWETSTPGSRLEFKFRGTHAKIYDIPATNGGQIYVTVDGVKTGPFPRVHTPWWSRLYAFPVATDVDPEKVHTVVIELDSGVPEKQKDPSVKPEFYEGIRWLCGQIMTDGEVVIP